jgi:hypothetical protein
MSRSAVSWEALVSAAHFGDVSLPSKPSSRRLSALRWRSLSGAPASASQNRALRRTAARMPSAPSKGQIEAGQEPLEPRGHVEAALQVGGLEPSPVRHLRNRYRRMCPLPSDS